MKKTQRLQSLKKQQGFNLLEMMFVTAMVAGIATIIFSTGKGIMDNQRMNTAHRDITQIAQTAQSWRGSLPSYSGIKMDDLDELLPPHIGDGVGTNPWGADYIIADETLVKRHFQITVDGLSEDVVTKMENQFKATTVSTTTTLTSITLVFKG